MRPLGAWLLCLLAHGASAQAPGDNALGRLLLSPAEREALPAQRLAGSAQHSDSPSADAAAAAPPAVPRLRLDGLVHRQALPAVAFLNQRPVEDGGEFLDYRLVAGERSVTLIAADGRRFRLQVGQVLLRDEGRIADPVPHHALSSPP
jgi:hypothetical protein